MKLSHFSSSRLGQQPHNTDKFSLLPPLLPNSGVLWMEIMRSLFPRTEDCTLLENKILFDLARDLFIFHYWNELWCQWLSHLRQLKLGRLVVEVDRELKCLRNFCHLKVASEHCTPKQTYTSSDFSPRLSQWGTAYTRQEHYWKLYTIYSPCLHSIFCNTVSQYGQH